MLDPRGLLLTGLTRDGNFVIENGRVVAPARNLRFNQSLAQLFAKIDALGPTQRTWSALRDQRGRRGSANADRKLQFYLEIQRHLIELAAKHRIQ